MQVVATFYVGFGSGRWKCAGPYFGRGRDAIDASDNAMSRCAIEYAGEDVLFMTFASLAHVEEETPARVPSE